MNNMPSDIHVYRNPGSTSSMIVENEGNVYLVKRKHNPYAGMWALPGGFLNCDKESLEECAVRELKEETSIIARIEDLELLCVNSSPTRDPRGHVIDHVYIVKKYSGTPKADDDAADLKLFPLDNLPEIAFDHRGVLEKYKSWRQKYG
jgi:8-oxo-dGTP diphosphatase